MVSLTLPVNGQANWDTPLNAALTALNAGKVDLGAQVIDAKAQYGATGNDVTDDTTAIQAALDACPAGGVVYLPAGSYRTSAPLVVAPGKTLMSTHTNLMKVTGLSDPACRIKPLGSFSGVAVIRFLDQATGGYSAISGEQRLLNLMIDGSALPASVDGIQAKGNIQNIGLRDVTIRQCTGNGIFTGSNAGAYPYSWRMFRVMLDNNTGHGLSMQNHTDLTMVDCQAIGNGANGFVLNNMANSQALGCRAEWNGNHGFYLTGPWGTGTGSGGMLLSGCSTDRNGFNGVFIDATGNTPIQIENLMTRRDGRNGGAGGGGYAGLNCTGATLPVLAGQVVCYPGVDDDGSGTNSPQYGARFATCTYVSVASGFLHAATTGWSDAGTNTVLRRGPNIGERTGTTAAPVDAFSNPWTAAGNATVTGYFVAAAGQSNGVWNIFDGTAAALAFGTAGGGIQIKEGTNARMGVSTLVGGTVTVANTSVTANTRIFLTCQTPGGTPGFLRVSARSAGTNFTILSSSGTDTSVVGWLLVEPS